MYVDVLGQKEEYDRQHGVQREMYEMLQEYGSRISTTDQMALDDLKTSFQDWLKALETASVFVNSGKPLAGKLLDEEVKAVLSRLQVRRYSRPACLPGSSAPACTTLPSFPLPACCLAFSLPPQRAASLYLI